MEVDAECLLVNLCEMVDEHSEHSGLTGWRSLIVLLGVALSVVVVADLVLRRLSPPKYVREVADAMKDYEHEDPTVLVLGSSHARTFHVMDGIIRDRTDGRERILAVPLEWGKFRSYEWLLHNRIETFIDEKGPSGSASDPAANASGKKRPSLKRFILLTAWWDACWTDGDPPVFNLPSRAWTFDHFEQAVIDKGLDDHSRNYVTSRWGDLWHGSILVSDRGHGHLITALRDRVRPPSEEAKRKQWEWKLESWKGIMHQGKKCGLHPEELAAAERILAWGQDRGYDVTLMLYPMMPVTVDDDDREHVQKPFQEAMRALAEKRGVRFVDATFVHNVKNEDFLDFDHLSPEAHARFSEWLLEGELSFLAEGDRVAGGTLP